MPRPVKQENASQSAAPVGSITVTSVSQNGQTGRFSRSGAPSADTRLNLTGSYDGGADDEDDAPVLMQVRKIEPRLSESLPERLHGPSQANVSFVSHGFTAIRDKVKELNDTLGELQSLGIQHVTSLPELVLVGDQSAGKSSLMSSFSGIYLPRSEGACTRCPVHIRLSASQGAWSCRVSLQQDYEYRPPAPVTRANPFGPWFKKRRDIKGFANLTDPSQIEETLRWAQIATLNPNNDHSLYRPESGEIWRRFCARARVRDDDGGDGEQRNEAAFSPNTVAVDISAPDLADLSFYDLPGVFTSAKRDEDQYLVKVVENLTAKYIAHEQAIILWAVPMNADPETSSTFSIIRAQRAQARTIGIMTKADLLPPNPGAATQWMAMLRGQQHVVGHGYFITARPVVPQSLLPDDLVSQRDPSRPADELERQAAFEEAFFNRQLPSSSNQEWRDCFQDFEDRCGVSRLVSFMSERLGHEFAKCLPEIKEKVTTKLIDVNCELAQLPDMPENPELEIRRSLAEFAAQIRQALEGPELSPLLADIVQHFQREIADLKPRYLVNVGAPLPLPPPAAGRTDVPGRIDLTRDDDLASVLSAPSPAPSEPQSRRRRHADFLERQEPDGPQTPSKRTRGPGSVKQESQPDLSPLARLYHRADQPPPQQPRPRALSLLRVRDIINAMSKPGMPNIVTEDVYNSLCMEAVKPWNGPLLRMLDRVYQLLDDKLHAILRDALGNLRERRIFKTASAVLRAFLSERLAALRATLLQHCALETRKVYTLDKESMLRHEETEAKILTRHRHHHRMVQYLGDRGSERAPPRPWEAMAEEERLREKHAMNQELAKLGPDPFKTELAVCAYVRGYYLTASTRFVDTCTLHVVSGLLPDVVDTLSKWYLDAQLGIFDRTTPQAFLDLMDEDAATADKRASLKADRRRFELTIESIQRLESPSQPS